MRLTRELFTLTFCLVWSKTLPGSDLTLSYSSPVPRSMPTNSHRSVAVVLAVVTVVAATAFIVVVLEVIGQRST